MEGRLLATTGHVKALVQSHSSGDEARFRAVVHELAEQAARNGRRRDAEEVRGALAERPPREERRASTRSAPPEPPPAPAPVVQPRGELGRVLTVSRPEEQLADLALSSDVMARLHRVLTEQRHADALRARGFEPLRTLLLTGPPGTGKSMTARVVATELGLPVFTVRLDAVAELPADEAATALTLVFDLLAQARAVCLFDDLDALLDADGGERGGGERGGGRLREVLRRFTALLDADASRGVVVVTTNRPELLERPVLRRFDTVLDYPLPSTGVVQEVVLRRLRGFDLGGVEWPRVASTASGLSHEQVAAAAALAAKQSVLDGAAQVETAALLAALRERRQVLRMAP
ncbi:AAA family ATPase [Kineococcus sp. SYSU DK006]|uniref:AAA family ATPase n=1 Tax=Kineococcus sp. SYSU DK006 TaxID=3383127 RepID=UPI003D7DBCBB